MSKQNLILIALVSGMLMMGGLFYLYFSSNKPVTTGNTSKNTNQTNPFGNTSGNKQNTLNDSGQPSNINQNDGLFGNTNKSKLLQLFRNPVSGFTFFTNKNKESVLRFVDRANGNIYQYLPSIHTGEVTRLTNTTIPKIQESVWLNSGNNLVYRYLDGETDDIVSFSASVGVDTTDSPGEITGSFISKNIKQLVSNPTGNKMFGLLNNENNIGSYGITLSSNGKDAKEVFTSSVKDWNISWPKENTISFLTKPSYKYQGYLYFYNLETNSFDRVLGDFFGMSIMANNSAGLVAYSYNTNGSVALNVYDVSGKNIIQFNLETFADKCVWGNLNSKILYCGIPNNLVSGNYPDDWYQGLTSFKDDIWKIDIESGETENIYTIGSNENTSIDVYDIKMSQDDKYLSFSNKSDLSLWLLDISKE